MEQYLTLIQENIRPGIVKHEIDGDVKFEINGNFMRELRRKLFKGTDDEDAHEHVRRVLEIVELFHFPGITHDAVMLRVFPITLSGPALRLKNRLSAGLITTWDLLEKVFTRKYCPPFKTAMKLEKICNFKQEMDETLYHAWERYNDLLFRSQDLKSIQVMADHSHNLYDEATTRESINDSSDNVDTKKLKKISMLFNERVKAKTKMDKKDIEEPVPRDLPIVQPYFPPTPFPGHPKKQKDNLYKTRKTVRIPKKFLQRKLRRMKGTWMMVGTLQSRI
ncbi:reverse transcriptase domain-containing protein [Tanacetum coccineum]